MIWTIDGTINLSQICTDNSWVLADVVTALVLEGITPDDALIFATYVFRVHAEGPGFWPQGILTEETWDRLTYDGKHPGE